MLFEDDREGESDRDKHQNIFEHRDQHGMVVINKNPSITTEQLKVVDHFICFVRASAQNREQQYDRSPDEKNDTRRSLRPVKHTLFVQFDRKNHTECHNQQINGQSDEEDNGEVIVEGVKE